jgi:hypothetical protein
MVGEAAMALSDHAVHLHQARGLGFVSSDKYVVRYGERERRTSAGGFVGASPGRARRHSLSGDGARVRPPSTPHKQASVDVSTHAERPPSSLPSAHQNPQWTRGEREVLPRQHVSPHSLTHLTLTSCCPSPAWSMPCMGRQHTWGTSSSTRPNQIGKTTWRWRGKGGVPGCLWAAPTVLNG